MILAGDVGGTNTRLAVLEISGGLRVVRLATFRSREHATLEQMIDAFLADRPEAITAACLGVAGPVKGGRAVATNLPWAADAGALATRLGLPTVGLINDLEANAWGLSMLAPSDFEILHPGTPAIGGAAVLAAGTGLGQAGLFWNGTEHVPIASEGGHADFAPRNELEIELLRYLGRRLHSRVSYDGCSLAQGW